LETALSLAPLPPATVDREQDFVVITGDDGQPQVVSLGRSEALPAACEDSPPKLLPSAIFSMLKQRLERLGYTVAMDIPRTGNSLYTRITVSWK
jgi:hypothetical protein